MTARFAAFLLGVGIAFPAAAHTTEKAFVLLLPTDLYVTGGVLVVAASLLLIALVPASNLRVVRTFGIDVGRPPDSLGTVLSLVTLAAMIGLLAAGHLGTPDPLANPLPLTVWTLWWIGLTAVHALFGNLWSVLNPWRGLYELLAGLPGLGAGIARPPLAYPDWLGYWPAAAQFLAFAWFELIFAAPRNPEILANAVGAYFAVNLIAMLLFGKSHWLRYGEAFSVFFRMVSWLSPFGKPNLVTLPGLGLLQLPPLPMSGVAFVLLALSTVSFDGLSKTFWWLGLIGVNPLEFPGRSAVALANTLGLLAAFAALLAGFVASVWLGRRLAGQAGGLGEALGATVLSIVPIALGYHLAHYLTEFLVDAQYAAIALADPFGLGWDLFGLGAARVTTSFLNNLDAVRLIWRVQVAAIVIAHVAAVAIAHLVAIRRTGRRRAAIVGQLPLSVLMVAYTLFGLWLLASPTAG
jgi:hypothetical protein